MSMSYFKTRYPEIYNKLPAGIDQIYDFVTVNEDNSYTFISKARFYRV